VAEDGDGPIFFHCQTVLWFVETIDNSNFLFYGLYKPYNSRNFFLFCGLYKPQKKKKLYYSTVCTNRRRRKNCYCSTVCTNRRTEKYVLLFYDLYKP